MIVYGRHPVREALRGRRTVRRIWATKNALREPWLRQQERLVVVTPSPDIEQRSGSADHQGVCAEVSEFHYAGETELLAAGSGLIVALDQIQDPQNLGAICRTAECAGAAGVVIPERRAAQVTAAVCKASAGAVEHLPLAKVRNLADFLGAARASGWWCYGAAADASMPYDQAEYPAAVVLVLGSEERGLRPRVAGGCDELVSIPLRGKVGSLSVSAAAAVLIYGLSPGLTVDRGSVTLPRGR